MPVKKPGTPEAMMEWLDPGRNVVTMSDDPKTPVILPDEDEEAEKPELAPDVAPDQGSGDQPPADDGAEAPAEPPPAPPAEGDEGNEQRALGAAPENRAL